MRVAMYYPWIYLKGGIERTIMELSLRSRHEWTIFTSHFQPEDTFPEYQGLDVRILGSVSIERNLHSVAAACARLLSSAYDWSDFGAVMVSCDGIGNLITLRSSGAPLLCLCHTPLKIAYDEHAHERWRRMFRPGILGRAGVQLFTHADRLAWRRYQRIFCVSAEVQRRLQKAGVAKNGQTEVLHPGVDLSRMQPSGRREPYLLLPGRIMWSKNVELGLNAFLDFKHRTQSSLAQEMRLIIAGAVDGKSESYFKSLRDLAGSCDNVEFVTNPSDTQLFDLYDRCHAVLFTPPNEDWGIVPLEAMAFGKPVISVARGGPSESIVDGETGFLCDDTPAAFTDAMLKLADSNNGLYERMSISSRERVRRFTWDVFVERIDHYLDTLAEPAVIRETVAG